MKLGRGTRSALNKADFVPEDVALVLERFEAAVPHLHFEAWRVRNHHVNDVPTGEVLWKNAQRTLVQINLDLRGNVRLTTVCRRDSGAIPRDDYEFVLGLASEAAPLVQGTLDSSLSLFEFGTQAVADEVQRRADLEEDPLPVIRFVRSLSQETYENQRVSYGLIFGGRFVGTRAFAEAFDNKRVKRLTDGFSTALILDSKGRIAGYTALTTPEQEGLRLARRPWWSAGLASKSHSIGGVGLALLRNGDMLVVYKNRMLFSLRAGRWQLWNHAAILLRLNAKWVARGNPRNVQAVLGYLFHVALDLSFRRSGGLLVVLARRSRLRSLLVSRTDELGARGRGAAEQALDTLLSSRPVQSLDRRIIADVASMDGALVVNRVGHVLAFGAMTKTAGGAQQGARTRAAIAASREGMAIKISSDGGISLYADGKRFMQL